MSSAPQGTDTDIFSSFLFSHFFSDSDHLSFLTLLVRVLVYTHFCSVLFLLLFCVSLSCLDSASATVLVALSQSNDFPILNLDTLSHQMQRMFNLIHRSSLLSCYPVRGTR